MQRILRASVKSSYAPPCALLLYKAITPILGVLAKGSYSVLCFSVEGSCVNRNLERTPDTDKPVRASNLRLK